VFKTLIFNTLHLLGALHQNVLFDLLVSVLR